MLATQSQQGKTMDLIREIWIQHLRQSPVHCTYESC